MQEISFRTQGKLWDLVSLHIPRRLQKLQETIDLFQSWFSVKFCSCPPTDLSQSSTISSEEAHAPHANRHQELQHLQIRRYAESTFGLEIPILIYKDKK